MIFASGGTECVNRAILRLAPWRLWRFYCPRATIEKPIRDLLYDLPLGPIPSGARVANVAFFQLVLVAYDLAQWCKRLCVPPRHLQATLETLRTDSLVVPARWLRRGGRNVLHLPPDYDHCELLVAAHRRAVQLRCRVRPEFAKAPRAKSANLRRFCVMATSVPALLRRNLERLGPAPLASWRLRVSLEP